MSYEGWDNWDTWVIALWAGNDRDLYENELSIMAEMLEQEKQARSSPEPDYGKIIQHYRRAARVARTNGDRADFSLIDWDELVNDFMLGYEEYKQYHGEGS